MFEKSKGMAALLQTCVVNLKCWEVGYFERESIYSLRGVKCKT